MPPISARTPPPWFRGSGILFVLWGIAGVAAFYFHATMGADTLSAMADGERRYYLALPGWFVWVYAIATWAGLLGAVALVARRRIAVHLFALAVLAVVMQFGWVFAATDLIARKGALATVPFPVVILAVALLQWSVARRGTARDWLR